MEKVIITEETANQRIDKILTDITEYSRSTVQVMIKEGTITVNETTVKNNYKLKIDDVIIIEELEEREIDIVAEDLPIDIVYQDSDLLIVNKSDKMVVHPGAGNPAGTLVNALLFHVKDLEAIKGEIRPGIVHRIDKETSGLLMVAKNGKALEHLSNQLKDKTATRKYIALVEGIIPHNLGKINAPIGRDPKNRQRMAVTQKGKSAVTNFKVLARYDDYTLIECELETGRTHQIRVHLNYINHPVVGDPKYGKRKTDTTHGQYLHAKTLGFIHPTTDKYIEFDSELPAFFQEMLDNLDSEHEQKDQ
jgi:23S rRNA pseudouridine1911/1915/1917 synthase